MPKKKEVEVTELTDQQKELRNALIAGIRKAYPELFPDAQKDYSDVIWGNFFLCLSDGGMIGWDKMRWRPTDHEKTTNKYLDEVLLRLMRGEEFTIVVPWEKKAGIRMLKSMQVPKPVERPRKPGEPPFFAVYTVGHLKCDENLQFVMNREKPVVNEEAQTFYHEPAKYNERQPEVPKKKNRRGNDPMQEYREFDLGLNERAAGNEAENEPGAQAEAGEKENLYANPDMTLAEWRMANYALRCAPEKKGNAVKALNTFTEDLRLGYQNSQKDVRILNDFNNFFENNRKYERNYNRFLDNMVNLALSGEKKVPPEGIRVINRELAQQDSLFYLAIHRDKVKCGVNDEMNPNQAVLRQMEKRANVLYKELDRLNIGHRTGPFTDMLKAMKRVSDFRAVTPEQLRKKLQELKQFAEIYMREKGSPKRVSKDGQARYNMAMMISSFAENADKAAELLLDPKEPIAIRHLSKRTYGNFFPEASDEVLNAIRPKTLEDKKLGFHRLEPYQDEEPLRAGEKRKADRFDFSFHDGYGDDYEDDPGWTELLDKLAKNFVRNEMKTKLAEDPHAAEKETASKLAARYEAVRYGQARNAFIRKIYQMLPKEEKELRCPEFSVLQKIFAESVQETAEKELKKPYRRVPHKGETAYNIDPVMDETNSVSDPYERADRIIEIKVREAVENNIQKRKYLKKIDVEDIIPEVDGEDALQRRAEPIDPEAIRKRSMDFLCQPGGLKDRLTVSLSRIPEDRPLTLLEREKIISANLDMIKLENMTEKLKQMRSENIQSDKRKACEEALGKIYDNWKKGYSFSIDLPFEIKGIGNSFSVPRVAVPGIQEYFNQKMQEQLRIYEPAPVAAQQEALKIIVD